MILNCSPTEVLALKETLAEEVCRLKEKVIKIPTLTETLAQMEFHVLTIVRERNITHLKKQKQQEKAQTKKELLAIKYQNLRTQINRALMELHGNIGQLRKLNQSIREIEAQTLEDMEQIDQSLQVVNFQLALSEKDIDLKAFQKHQAQMQRQSIIDSLTRIKQSKEKTSASTQHLLSNKQNLNQAISRNHKQYEMNRSLNKTLIKQISLENHEDLENQKLSRMTQCQTLLKTCEKKTQNNLQLLSLNQSLKNDLENWMETYEKDKKQCEQFQSQIVMLSTKKQQHQRNINDKQKSIYQLKNLIEGLRKAESQFRQN